jgi:hypothetical protein
LFFFLNPFRNDFYVHAPCHGNDRFDNRGILQAGENILDKKLINLWAICSEFACSGLVVSDVAVFGIGICPSVVFRLSGGQ